MKAQLLFLAIIFQCANLKAQVTQINSNNSLYAAVQLNSVKSIFVSNIDSSIWTTDGTPAGTFQLSETIKAVLGGELLNGNYIFAGISLNCGTEIFITDGSKGGTKIIKDIIPGTTGSAPDADMAILNGYVYFTAATPLEGRELWRTDGTAGNTSLVKDIIPGATGSNDPNKYDLFSNGTYLLFDVKTVAEGNELWRSDGTSANTFLLKDIYTGPLSSNPNKFFPFNSMVLFAATDATHGEEIWKTDGTAGGIVLLKDIYAGVDSSTYIPVELFPGFTIPYPVFSTFHLFNNHLFFMANDGVNGSAIWVTDGTTLNTSLLKVTLTDTSLNSFLLLDAINLPGKFMFPVSNLKDRFELWQSDGTPSGTVLFKSFPVNTNNNYPFIYLNYSYDSVTHTVTYPLYNGNFFFSANGTEGNELWKSNGTPGGTIVVKDINPGAADGIVNPSYLYTTAGLFFAADDGVHGNELWKSDGTTLGTTMVADIFLNAHNADPQLFFITNSKIIFGATNGPDPDSTLRDLWAVDGNFTPLPVQLLDFTVKPNANNALLQWSTSQEINSKEFTIQSSDDAQHWRELGNVPAAGNSSVKNNYSFTDVGIINSGKTIFYYRLVATDIDGKTSISNIISLKISGIQKWNIQLFSNPVHDNVRVILTGITGLAELSINDMAGKTLYKKQIQNQNGQFSIPVNLQSGMYIMVIKTNNESKAIKFLKE
ncbi:MAG TPA: T9SS type A sorting domain-containing protein [Hanamia sp.]